MLQQIKTIPFLHNAKVGNFWLGLVLVLIVAGASEYLASITWLQSVGLSAMTIAILLGIVIGNSLFTRISSYTASGVDFSKNSLLRLGIICYGFRITFQQISAVGWSGLLIAASMLTTTFLLAIILGTKLFKLDKQTVLLIGAGSSICGAAAIMAAEPIVKGQAHKVSVAVATVVVFGTLAMFLYPIIFPYLGLSEQSYGIFAGSTIHEVAQVVVAGKNVSEAAAATAVIEKMLRVMLLAPFLMLLAISLNNKAGGASKAKLTIPWFAVLFIAVAIFNSLYELPSQLITIINELDTLLLTMAMLALGIRTHLGAIRQAGVKPLLLAASLFLFLTVGGYLINLGIQYLFINY